MRLNTLKPGAGARKAAKRLGRGCGSGLGKTADAAQGPKSRGGYHKVGSKAARCRCSAACPSTASARAPACSSTDSFARTQRRDRRNHRPARPAARPGAWRCERVKVIASGTIEKAVHVKGLGVTRGAKALIEAAGGRVED